MPVGLRDQDLLLWSAVFGLKHGSEIGSIIEQISICSTSVGSTSTSTKIDLTSTESTNIEEPVRFEEEVLEYDDETRIFAFDEEILQVDCNYVVEPDQQSVSIADILF